MNLRDPAFPWATLARRIWRLFHHLCIRGKGGRVASKGPKVRTIPN